MVVSPRGTVCIKEVKFDENLTTWSVLVEVCDISRKLEHQWTIPPIFRGVCLGRIATRIRRFVVDGGEFPLGARNL